MSLSGWGRGGGGGRRSYGEGRGEGCCKYVSVCVCVRACVVFCLNVPWEVGAIFIFIFHNDRHEIYKTINSTGIRT